MDYPRRWALAGLIVVVPMLVVMRVVFRGGSALTGRIGRHSTAGLAGVAAASLVLRSLMKVLDAAIRNLVAKEAS